MNYAHGLAGADRGHQPRDDLPEHERPPPG